MAQKKKMAELSKGKRIALWLRRIFFLWLLYTFICLVIPPLFHREASGNEAGEGEAFIIGGGEQGVAAVRERVLSIDDNQDALLWRLRLIEAAQEELVLVTFDFRDDNSGRDIMAALFHAADRGVEVRILIDGINGALHLTGNRNFRELAAHENVQVKLYNPINLLTPWKLNYRMHDKYLIADDLAYILGGRNTDDLFLGNYADSYNEDRDLLVYEPVPGEDGSRAQLEEYFEQIWDLPCCKAYGGRASKKPGGPYLTEHYQQLLTTYPEAFAGPEGKAEDKTEEQTEDQAVWEVCWKPLLEEVSIAVRRIELATGPIRPRNKEPRLWERMLGEMNGETDILIQTPYIICSEKMYEDLAALSAGGARVEMITNAVESGTNPFGCTDYLNQKKRVQETGIHTYEYLRGQALHTKTILAGENISMVGSCNLDMRSIYLDTEMMLIIDSPELNTAIRGQAEELKLHSRHVCPDGSVEDGAEYRPAGQSTGKMLMYGALRVLIIPFRHLLSVCPV